MCVSAYPYLYLSVSVLSVEGIMCSLLVNCKHKEDGFFVPVNS